MTTPFAALLLLIVALAWWRGPGWKPRALPGVTRTRPWTLGHRGARDVAPENTEAAFRLAFRHLDGIETDVQPTRDGALVLWHDFDCQGAPVRSLTFAELQTRVPDILTLDALLDLALDAPGTVLNLEIKSDPRIRRGFALERDTIRAVRARDLMDRVLISSFDPLSILRVRLLAPSMRVALLTAAEGPMFFQEGRLARWLHVDALHPEDQQVTTSLIARCVERGLPVHVWTVNDADRIRELIRVGAGGIIGDDPEALARTVREA